MAAKVDPAVLKAALEMKAKGLLSDEQFAEMTGQEAPKAEAAPKEEKAVVSGKGNPGAMPAVEKKGAKAKASAPSGKDKLKGLGKKTASTAKKSKTPEVMIPEAQDMIEEYVENLGKMKAAKARVDELGEDIARLSEPHRVELSRKMGALQASLYVNKRVTFVQPHGYKMVGEDKEEALREVFGDEYDGFILPKMEVKVADADALAEVYDQLEAICKETGIDIEKLFSVKNTLAPTEALTAARVMRPDIEALFAKAVELGLLEPKKATIKEK